MMMFGNSEPYIEKLPSERRKTKTKQNLREKATIMSKGSSKFLTDLEKHFPWNGSFRRDLRIEYSSAQSPSSAIGKISAIRSVHMRQTDMRTAEKRSKYCPGSKRSLKNSATSSIVMSEQTTINSILMNLRPVQSVTAPVRARTSLPSGAPAEHFTLGQMLAGRPK